MNRLTTSLVMGLVLFAAGSGPALADSFSAGSVILPADSVWQDSGGLEIHGLVHTVLRFDIPLHWSIQAPKPIGGIDFTAQTVDWSGGAPASRDFAAGPWIIAAEDLDTDAEFLIDQWLLAHPSVEVYVADQPFSAPIERTLIAAPSLALFADDGLSTVAGYLNAASIADDEGRTWPNSVPAAGDPAFPHVVTESTVVGPSAAVADDGVLWESSGYPYYLSFSSGRWNGPVPLGFEQESLRSRGMKQGSQRERQPDAGVLTPWGAASYQRW